MSGAADTVTGAVSAVTGAVSDAWDALGAAGQAAWAGISNAAWFVGKWGVGVLDTFADWAYDLIAESPEEYVDLNVRLALDRDWRQRLRETLRDRLINSPLMDAKRFTAALETRYRQMWQAWCEARRR